MDRQAKDRADARLEERLATAAVRDPRPPYRDRMRWLKQQDASAFEEALRYYEDTLVPEIAGGRDAVEAWLAYGRRLAELGGAGRLVEVDEVGRAVSWDGSEPRGLVLFIPERKGAPAFALSVPRDASPAQQATIQLLAEGRRDLGPV